MTTILQISDTHIAPEGNLVSRRLDTSDSLGRLIKRIKEICVQAGPIDAVLVSGDLSEDGSAESYARFKMHIAQLDVPLLVIPGNHDAREPMRRAFANQLPSHGPLNWERQVGNVNVIGLDTLVEAHGLGTLLPESLTFLRYALSHAEGTPVLLALHHPPFLTGINFMDDIGLSNRSAFEEAVSDFSGEMRIVCGHIHNTMVANIAGHTAVSAPSPCSTFAYDRRADAPVGYMAQEDGCLLHRWDAGFHSIRIGLAAGPGPFPF